MLHVLRSDQCEMQATLHFLQLAAFEPAAFDDTLHSRKISVHLSEELDHRLRRELLRKALAKNAKRLLRVVADAFPECARVA